MTVRLSGVDYGSTPRGMSSGLVRPVRWIVLHATDNTASARAEAHYAATRTDDRSRWTSSHFYVDEDEIVGSVPLDMRAWAAYSEANAHGWHLEMCGISGRVPAATIERTAGLVDRLAELDKVPVRHCGPSMVAALQRGITGHADITEGLNVGDHTDPGENFNWTQFISMVEEGDMPSAQDIAKAVWRTDNIVEASWPARTKENQFWQPGAVLSYGLGHAMEANAKLTSVLAELTAQRTIIKTLADALKSGGGDIDTVAVLAKLDGLVQQVAELEAQLAQAQAAVAERDQRLAAALAAAKSAS